MPDHIRLILKHAFVGFGVAVAFVGMLLYFNIANLWHLVTHTQAGPLAVAMLVGFFTITFGSVQIGFKIMTMGDDDEPRGGKRDTVRAGDTVPVPVHTAHPR